MPDRVSDRVRRIVVVEASNGQLEDELRLAISYSGVARPPVIEHVRRFGGPRPRQRRALARVSIEMEKFDLKFMMVSKKMRWKN